MASGRPLRGRNGNAGEFASILPTGWPPPNLETLRETFAGAGTAYPNIHSMLARFDPDHPAVEAWLVTVMPSVDLIASAISATLDPDMIVLGGRPPAALARRMIERIALINPERRGFHRPSPWIAASAIDGDAAAIGAATLPLRAAFFDPESNARSGDKHQLSQ